MEWNYEKVRASLMKDHDRIYADINQMKFKMRHDPSRFQYQYQDFIDKQNGVLCTVIMLLDSDALTDPKILLVRLDDMEQNFYEDWPSFSKEDDGVSLSNIRAGYIEKINKIREIAKGKTPYLG